MNWANFLRANSDAVIFCYIDILLYDLNAGGPLQLYVVYTCYLCHMEERVFTH